MQAAGPAAAPVPQSPSLVHQSSNMLSNVHDSPPIRKAATKQGGHPQLVQHTAPEYCMTLSNALINPDFASSSCFDLGLVFLSYGCHFVLNALNPLPSGTQGKPPVLPRGGRTHSLLAAAHKAQTAAFPTTAPYLSDQRNLATYQVSSIVSSNYHHHRSLWLSRAARPT